MALLQVHGLGQTDQETLTAYQQTMHNLALSIKAAEATGQMDAARMLRTQMRDLQGQIVALVNSLYQQEKPSGFMAAISSIADDLRSVGEAVPSVLKSTSVGLVAVALIYGLFMLGPMLRRGGGSKSW